MKGIGMKDKYIVFKREEWDELVRKDLRFAQWGTVERLSIEDAHVIREQDLFAPGVLATYAGAVQTAIEVIEDAGVTVPTHMFHVRDHFFMASNNSAMRPRKIPD